jgi:hypothetical protein
MPLIPEMQRACETNNVAEARRHSAAAAQNDRDHEHTSLSDSLDVAIAHQSNEVAELLFDMIRGYYRDDPINMLLALTSNGVSPLRKNGNIALADRIQDEIIAASEKVLTLDPPFLINAFEVDDREMSERLFAIGVDPDMRSNLKGFKNHSPLSLAAKNNAIETAEAILVALKEKYKDDPKKLRAALIAAPDEASKPEVVFRANGQNYMADSIAYELDVLDGKKTRQPVKPPAFSTSFAAPASKPHPIKPDRTLTLARLQETKADGRTNLQIFAEQRQLGDVFTAEIWQGRKDEMDKVWQLVKPEHQQQVDIVLVRQQIDAFGLRDRFRRDGDVAQGF